MTLSPPMWKASVGAFNECSSKVNKLVVRKRLGPQFKRRGFCRRPSATGGGCGASAFRSVGLKHLPNKLGALIFNHPFFF